MCLGVYVLVWFQKRENDERTIEERNREERKRKKPSKSVGHPI